MNPVVSATNNLRIGLTVLQVLSGINAGSSLLGLGQVTQIISSSPSSQVAKLLLVLLGVLIVALGVVSVFVIGWIKDWQARVSEWSQGQNLDKGRLEQLTSTLSRWLVWSQWGPIIVIGLFVLFLTVGGAVLGALWGGISSTGGSKGLNSLSDAGIFGGIVAFGALLLAAPIIILNWQILKNIKIWLLAVTDRALGHSGYTNLIGQSNTVSSWLVFSQVMVCILAVFTVLSLLRGSTGASTVSPVTLVLSLGGAFLNFMLLQWSKTFMFGVAGYAERYGSSAVELSKV